MLIEALTQRRDVYRPRLGGKVVWAEASLAEPPKAPPLPRMSMRPPGETKPPGGRMERAATTALMQLVLDGFRRDGIRHVIVPSLKQITEHSPLRRQLVRAIMLDAGALLCEASAEAGRFPAKKAALRHAPDAITSFVSRPGDHRVPSGRHAHELGGHTVGRLTGGDPSLLRRINSAVVLHALRGADFPTFTDLTRITGLSRPTVEGVVEGLMELGLVVESAPGEGEARRQGRPARRFRFRAEAGHLLGIEIGPHRVAALLSGLDGRIIGASSREATETASADERLDRVRVVVADVLRRAGVARSSLRAVGVGSPGIVEADGTVRLGTALPEWTGLALGERLRRSFRCPVLVENDANAAAVAEHWKGAATESDDIVFVLAGLSPGAGSLIGGRLHRGFGGAAGEIGALHLLGREVTPEKLLSTTDEPLHPLDERAVARVFALAKQGDTGAEQAMERFIQRLVHDVAALVLALDPELVVIGGWAAGLDGVLDPLRDELSRYCLRPPKVTLSLLGEAAVATGALRLALDHAEEELFAVEGTVTARR